jgi:hypothetical protein
MNTTIQKGMDLATPVVTTTDANPESALLQLIQNQDIVTVEQTLNEDLIADKYRLLDNLQKEYTNFKNAGDTELSYSVGRCNGCFCGQTAHQFTGNHSGRKIAILVDKSEKDEIVDLTFCAWSSDEKG